MLDSAEYANAYHRAPLTKRLRPLAYLPSTLTPTLSRADFLAAHSSIPDLIECCSVWYEKCGLLICPKCAARRAELRLKEWAELIDPDDGSLFVRLSVGSHHDLATAWDALERTRARFGKRAWLSSISSSWLRSTELTFNRGMWHPHDHLVIVGTADQLADIRTTIATKWCEAAADARDDKGDHEPVRATPAAQYVAPSRSTEAVTRYTLKGWMDGTKDPEGGLDPGLLMARARAGDVDALEKWTELERLVLANPKGLRTLSRGKGYKRKADYELTA